MLYLLQIESVRVRIWPSQGGLVLAPDGIENDKDSVRRCVDITAFRRSCNRTLLPTKYRNLSRACHK